VPGLGTSFGRGGATTFAMDLKFADSILIMGSNMAECHPVAFRWVIQAKTREEGPCTVIHADPRFTRTSAMANLYAPLRAGSDIVFLGALIKYVLDRHDDLFRRLRGKDGRPLSDRERFFRDYLTHYTNAPTLIGDDFKDAEELDGLFSGYDEVKRRYDQKKWRYASEPAQRPQTKEGGKPGEGRPHSFSALVGKLVGPPPTQDSTLQDRRCVFQILLRHYRRYTPELVEAVCGTPRAVFEKVAATLYDNAGPDKTGAICYAVGWTQHTTGVQMIRAAAVLQLLLGNVGRPGGGILALRGHATIQGSTDIATLYNLLPGYLVAPSAPQHHDTLYDYIDTETSATSFWSNLPAFFVSQLKAWFGADASAENGYAYDYLPRTVGDHSHLPIFVQMAQGTIKGFFAMGQNPAVGGQNASFQRKALAKLDWLVVRDLYETETASFWKDAPEIKSGALRTEDIPTEVFFLPAAAVAESDGSFTNTQRLVQWHHKAVDPPGEARSDVWFTVHLGLRLKELYKGSKARRDRPIQALVWDYIDAEENKKFGIPDEPSARLILKEINGYLVTPPTAAQAGTAGVLAGAAGAGPAGVAAAGTAATAPAIRGWSLKDALPLPSFGQLRDDGSTACGAWIYTGVFAPTAGEPLGHNHAANRSGDEWVAPGWAFSWPANRRILYNRASADPEGRPWAKEARLAAAHAPPLRPGQLLRVGGKAYGPGDPPPGYVYWAEVGEEAWHEKEKKKVLKWVGKWVGVDVPDFPVNKSPGTKADPKGVGVDCHDGASPFIMKADGKGWLFVPNGLVDGPLPTHYEPYESPLDNNPVYDKNTLARSNPAALIYRVPGNDYAPAGSYEFPHVLSTYRLTEHHLSGVMSRWLPWLAELMPELFCEISPEHAAQLGVRNTDWVRIRTPRGSIRAKALVTRRIRPFRLGGGLVVHHVGLPWHWGYKGVTTGDVANDLSALVGDPNVTIHEAKVFVCAVQKDEGG
jgi:formate dehydrogenase major subunit